jgi:hypothetical protein
LFGREAVVFQCGRTDSQNWCLIADPANPEFRYRISQRWIDSMPPQSPAISDRKKIHLALSYSALVRLTHFLREKISPCDALENTRDILGSNQGSPAEGGDKYGKRTIAKPRPADLAGHPTTKQAKVGLAIGNVIKGKGGERT